MKCESRGLLCCSSSLNDRRISRLIHRSIIVHQQCVNDLNAEKTPA